MEETLQMTNFSYLILTLGLLNIEGFPDYMLRDTSSLSILLRADNVHCYSFNI